MAEKQAAPALAMPRREEWVDVPEYDGFKVRLWVNYPQRFQAELTSGDEGRAMVAVKQIVLEHNGWPNEEGELLPSPSESAFWDGIPMELAVIVIALIHRTATRLPNSLAPRRSS